jgi:hypothetical protein
LHGALWLKPLTRPPASVTETAATGAFQVTPPSSLRDTITDGVFELGLPHTEYTRIPLAAIACGNTPDVPSFEPVIVLGALGNAVASVTAALPVADGDTWLVAVTVTDAGAGVASGAVYVPAALIVPEVAAVIDQSTDMSVSPVTVAVNG